MKENVFKSFLRDTYKTSSPIPFIITGQVLVFVLLHVFELLSYASITGQDFYLLTYEKLSLPSFGTLFSQPWALATHPFVYTDLLRLIFDCLWLYWLGKLFLNLLGSRQFLTVFIGGILIGAIIFSLSPLSGGNSNLLRWSGTGFGLAALICSMTLLSPHMELRLFIFGNVKFRLIAIIYLAVTIVFNFKNPDAIAGYIAAIGFGLAFMWQLQNGNDWSNLFKRKKRHPKHLKVVRSNLNKQTPAKYHPNKPSQKDIDQILDKISQNGYESLTSQEKEILFRASKQDQ